MKLSEKVKLIRSAEGMSQSEFCKEIGLSITTLKKYESGSYEPSGLNLVKITQHPELSKYTLWLMSDITAPAAGQIAPSLSQPESSKAKADH